MPRRPSRAGAVPWRPSGAGQARESHARGVRGKRKRRASGAREARERRASSACGGIAASVFESSAPAESQRRPSVAPPGWARRAPSCPSGARERRERRAREAREGRPSGDSSVGSGTRWTRGRRCGGAEAVPQRRHNSTARGALWLKSGLGCVLGGEALGSLLGRVGRKPAVTGRLARAEGHRSARGQRSGFNVVRWGQIGWPARPDSGGAGSWVCPGFVPGG